jgi:hypothetical protein
MARCRGEFLLDARNPQIDRDAQVREIANFFVETIC